MKQRRNLNIWLVAVLAFCLAPGAVLSQSLSKKKAYGELAKLSQDFEDLSERVGAAVVRIFATGYSPSFGFASSSSALLEKQRSTGSGVLLSSDGYVITNAHVVDGARRIQVLVPSAGEELSRWASILKPDRKLIGAQVIGIDRETDLAVLKVDKPGLPYLELGDSDELRQGELVLAFGSPMGLENSVTMGIVSAIARQIRPDAPVVYIQTDTPINPGNSGGPLVDSRGAVVGINTFILSQSGGSEGIGFAIPSNIVNNVFQQIRAHGSVRRGEIGVKAQTITPTLAAGLGLSQKYGVVLGDVFPRGPAYHAGLKAGDIVLSLDGKPMENGRQFDVNLYGRAISDLVTLEVLRGTEKRTYRVPIAERKNDLTRFEQMVSPERNLVPKLGILGLDLDSKIARMLPGLRKAEGVVVAGLASDAPFIRDALMPGDVIHTVNGQPIDGLAALRKAIDAFKFGDAVVLHVEKFGQMRFVAFEME